MRKIIYGSAVALMALSGVAMAQGTTAQSGGTAPGLVGTNGSAVGTNGGLKSGVGITETAPTMSSSSGNVTTMSPPKAPIGTDNSSGGAASNGSGGGNAGGNAGSQSK